jgi:hypothetical protein
MDIPRLRRAFKYPSDDDTTDLSPEEMDEQGRFGMHIPKFSPFDITHPGCCAGWTRKEEKEMKTNHWI